MKKKPVKQIILHVDTTGMKFNKPGSITKTEGDRILQISAIELIDGKRTGNDFHTRLNPEHIISKEATAIHHLKKKDIQHEPVFADIKDRFLAYIKDAELIAVNPWVKAFLNSELHRFVEGDNVTNYCREVTYTSKLHKKLHPDVSKHGLDGLCSFYKIKHAATDTRIDKIYKVYAVMSAELAKQAAKKTSVATKGMFATKVPSATQTDEKANTATTSMFAAKISSAKPTQKTRTAATSMFAATAKAAANTAIAAPSKPEPRVLRKRKLG